MIDPRRRRLRLNALALLSLVMLLVTSAVPGPRPLLVQAQESEAEGTGWSEVFSGQPTKPTPWDSSDWDIQVHSRDTSTFKQLEPMAAHHGSNCSAPPATHQITEYADAVFQCNDHVMTAINAGGYGAIYLTPDRMVDFSTGEAVVQFDMSTLRTSSRDWVDIWLSPFDDQLVLPYHDVVPDLTGPPRRAVQVMMDFNSGTDFRAYVYKNFDQTELDSLWWETYESKLTPSASRRDTFELRISRTSLKFGLPGYNLWWVDAKMPDLGWDKAVLQFGHHSYNPLKECAISGGCAPDTWHWDNVSISNAQPFTMLKADLPYVDAGTRRSVNFPSGAPSGAYLRFAGLGTTLDVSFDGGRSWQAARTQAILPDPPEDHFKAYWMPVPAGTTRVDFRGTDYGSSPWTVRGISIWSQSTDLGSQPGQPPVAGAPTSTPTPAPIAAPGPTATPQSAACSPRPQVAVRADPTSGGRLLVNAQVGRPSNNPNNVLRSIQFMSFSNASVEILGRTIGSAGGTVTAPAGTTGLNFVVTRQPAGSKTTVMVPFIVTDDCGPWNTFVGGGPSAF